MKNLLASGAVIALLCGPAFAADLTPQPVVPLTVQTSNLQNAFRASEIIGASVVNDADEKVGTIDDLLINRSDFVPYAILSVGGFLGVGEKNVAVPYKSMHIVDNKLVLPGATKEALKDLPEFKYMKD